MLFNSFEFAIFLPVVFLLYWWASGKKLIIQNAIILIASYYFYACWDWRFLFLLLFSTLLDFFTGLKMQTSKNQIQKRIWFWISISVNLGFLGVFKYYNFFAESFAETAKLVGLSVSPWTLQVVLPVGISFYTFHGLSYVIDIYKNRIPAESNFIDYAVFVSFFPLLVAGPIERATHLLPQIKTKRNFDFTKAVLGLKQILWGLFKKIVIADNCAIHANQIFNHFGDYSGSTLILVAFFFSFQIYGDFSGYSDIALGTARLFGIDLLRNFAFPYFSRDIAEFWRRWHISLSSWFRDYLYVPLGGSKGGLKMKIRNTLIIFLVSGFWHGANWTFIIWGAINAIYFIPLLITNRNRNHLEIVAAGKRLPGIQEFFSILTTFGLTMFAWIFFRSPDLSAALAFIKNILTPAIFRIPHFEGIGLTIPLFVFLFFFIAIEWLEREHQFALQQFAVRWPLPLRWIFYSTLLICIYYYAVASSTQEFIYFQF